MDLELRTKCKQVIVKEVSSIGTGAHVYLPKAWVGKKVAIILEPEGPLPIS